MYEYITTRSRSKFLVDLPAGFPRRLDGGDGGGGGIMERGTGKVRGRELFGKGNRWGKRRMYQKKGDPSMKRKEGAQDRKKGVEVVVGGDNSSMVRVPIGPNPILTRGYPAGALVRRGRGL